MASSNDEYLLLQEAIGSDGRRWYRSFTSTNTNGSWAPVPVASQNSTC